LNGVARAFSALILVCVMTIGEILIAESSNLLLLIPVVIELVMFNTLVSGKDGVHGTGLAPALWSSTRENLNTTPTKSHRLPFDATVPNQIVSATRRHSTSIRNGLDR
jgi:hypothetical protein